MTDDVEFEADKEVPRAEGNELAKREQAVIEATPKPNTVMIKLWGGSHLNFSPDSHVPIFAVLAMIILISASAIIGFIGIWVPGDAIWMDKLFTAFGHALTGIVGAMIGSAISSKSN